MTGAVFCIVSDSSDAIHVEIEGDEFVVKTEGTLEYELVAIDNEHDTTTAYDYTATLYNSAGESQSSAVSPSSGTVNNKSSETLTIDAPNEPGTYTLKVVLDDETGDKDEEYTRSVDIHVVTPIKLSAKLTNESTVGLDNFVVYFKVDGEVIKDSRQVVSVDSESDTTISYEWIKYNPYAGKHTFAIVSDSESIIEINGLDKENAFFVGQSDYSGLTTILVLLTIILLAVLIYIYRKPVKNLGKPKARR